MGAGLDAGSVIATAFEDRDPKTTRSLVLSE
jgi:hypothetical protein